MKYFIWIIVTLSLYSCSMTTECDSISKKIKEMSKGTGKFYSIPASSLVEFDWDYFYLVEGPKHPSEIEIITGAEYSQMIDDTSSVYLFVKNGKIIKQFMCHSHINVDLRLFDGKGFIKYHNTQQIRVEKNEVNGIVSYRIIE